MVQSRYRYSVAKHPILGSCFGNPSMVTKSMEGVMTQEHGCWSQIVSRLCLLILTLGQSLKSSVPQFLYLCNGGMAPNIQGGVES